MCSRSTIIFQPLLILVFFFLFLFSRPIATSRGRFHALVCFLLSHRRRHTLWIVGLEWLFTTTLLFTVFVATWGLSVGSCGVNGGGSFCAKWQPDDAAMVHGVLLARHLRFTIDAALFL